LSVETVGEERNRAEKWRRDRANESSSNSTRYVPMRSYKN
jgi:hypothetical protein